MIKIKRKISKWSLLAAKAGLAASILMGSAGLSQADEFEGFSGLDFGSIVQGGLERSSRIWFGVDRPLKESAPPTTGAYRSATQPASAQVLLADGLKAEYVTRSAANNADMFAFWPSDESPTHLIFCIEGGRQDLGTFLPGGLIKKFNPGVQRIKLSDGSVETILRGTTSCDGIRRTAWQTILATEETSDGGAYEIINPLNVTNHTITDRTLGAVMDENGMPSTSITKRTALPKIAFEGLGITPEGVVYSGDELRPGTPINADGGAMFKFIPANPRTTSDPIGNLSESPWPPATCTRCRSPAKPPLSNSDKGVRSGTEPGSASVPRMRGRMPMLPVRLDTTARRILNWTTCLPGPELVSAGPTPVSRTAVTMVKCSVRLIQPRSWRMLLNER